MLGNMRVDVYNGLRMKIQTHPVSDKQHMALEYLKFGTIMVFVDSRHEGVIVPEYLKNDYQLRLNFDYAFEIDDFQILKDRFEASLSFNRKNFFCVVPMDAVYLILNHATERGALFVESVPSEMLSLFTTQPPLQPVATASEEDVPKKMAKSNNPDDTTVKQSPEKTPRKKSHLRLVK